MILGVSVKYNGKSYHMKRPNRHHHLIYSMRRVLGAPEPTGDEQGFYDETTQFISREDALAQVLRTGELKTHLHPAWLCSEDLW